VSGANVRGDLYTVSAVSPVDSIAAVRLEALPDASLPNNGPGRHSSGNFQLNEFRIQLRTGDGATDLTPLRIESATASFDYKAPDADIAGTIDESLNKVWHVWGHFGKAHQAIFRLKSTSATGKDALVVVELRHQNFDQAINLGRFRLSVSADPDAYVNTERRFAAMKMDDPWAKLAAAYYLIGDQTAVDQLLEQHPHAAQGIGDLYALNGNWQRAIEEYSKRIKDQTNNATLLSKRAAAYIATEQWTLAKADWLRAVALKPDQMQAAFDPFQQAQRWSDALAFGEKLIEINPNESLSWLNLAPVAAVAGDETYRDFCRRYAQHFKETTDAMVAERMIKACLLKPGSVDLDTLPRETLAKALDEETAADWLRPWAWASRALLAYRRGDAASAVNYVANSEALPPRRRLTC
jgi:tetratricopeptide (TPR) repeat protein